MVKNMLLLLLSFVLISGCNKENEPFQSGRLYTLSLGQIKAALKGSWDVRSKCYITIAGLDCKDIKDESLIFSGDDSLFWTKNGEVTKRDKVEFYKVKSPDGYGYEIDSLYVFRFAKDDGDGYVPKDIRHDSLFVDGAFWAADAGFGMVLTRSK